MNSPINCLPDSPTVTAPWLKAKLEQSPEKSPEPLDMVIIDCRFSLAEPDLGRKQYQASHLPGAYYLDLNQDLSSPRQRHGGRHPLPDLAQLATKLAALGITLGETLVVAYDDSRFAFAARLWWLLRYLGHDRVFLLDGGFSGWQHQGYPLTPELPPAPAKIAKFIPQLRPEMLVDIHQVKARQGNTALVDSREPERYRGEREPIDPVAGCIPGALNYPWQEVTDTRGYLQPLAVHQERWERLQETTEIMVYCGSGVTACVNLLSLEIAGIKTGKLYAGSWSDWCSYF
ncbi:MAG: sulfurtransferase [Coleofasciculaceae cyanobacterium SM2_1_6]|nr:sulfurtransferase [Coleofasciculaceae cyanobacterium SM2_1_6]